MIMIIILMIMIVIIIIFCDIHNLRLSNSKGNQKQVKGNVEVI